jgi:hypothetical protein
LPGFSWRKSQCQDHLHNLVIALHSYEGTHKVYPYGHQQEVGGARHRRDCWYQRILPFIEEGPLSKLYEADTTEYVHQITNNTIRQASPEVLSCPSNPDNPARGGNGGTAAFQGNYAVCAGVGTGRVINVLTQTMTVGPDLARQTISGDPGGMFYRNSRTNPATCTDGTSNVLYMSEGITRGVAVAAWGELGGYWGGAPHGSFGFSTAEVPNSSVADRNYTCKATTWPSAPNKAPCEAMTTTNNGRWNFARSYHAGGVQAVMGDGKVHFFSENVDLNTWMRLGVRNDAIPTGRF